MAQHAFRGTEPRVLVEDAAHVLVGRDQTFHQHVGLARDDGGDGQLHALDVALLVEDAENPGVDAVFAADLLDDGLFAVERGLDQPLPVGGIDRLDGVRILTVGDGQTLFAFLSRFLDDFAQMLNHDYSFFWFLLLH